MGSAVAHDALTGKRPLAQGVGVVPGLYEGYEEGLYPPYPQGSQAAAQVGVRQTQSYAPITQTYEAMCYQEPLPGDVRGRDKASDRKKVGRSPPLIGEQGGRGRASARVSKAPEHSSASAGTTWRATRNGSAFSAAAVGSNVRSVYSQ